MEFYIKNKSIYFKSQKSSKECLLSNLTDRIHSKSKQAIAEWKQAFGDQTLDSYSIIERGWLDMAFEVFPDRKDKKEIKVFKTTNLPKELFIKLFEEDVTIIY